MTGFALHHDVMAWSTYLERGDGKTCSSCFPTLGIHCNEVNIQSHSLRPRHSPPHWRLPCARHRKCVVPATARRGTAPSKRLPVRRRQRTLEKAVPFLTSPGAFRIRRFPRSMRRKGLSHFDRMHVYGITNASCLLPPGVLRPGDERSIWHEPSRRPSRPRMPRIGDRV